jgi:acetyl esterase/lipase
MHLVRTALVVSFAALACACPSLESFYRARDLVGARVDVEYAADHIAKHRLDVYYPRDTKEAWPVVVFVHGGYWRGGDKTYWQAITGLYGNAGIALGELGVGTVVTNYRLHPEAKLDDMLDDIVGAMAWTRAHVKEMGGDPDRIYLAGHSAGGHLVSLLGTNHDELRKRGFEPAWLKGVVAVSGIYDIPTTTSLVDEELRTAVFLPLFSHELEKQRAASPLTHFNKDMTPTYFIVGENDYKSCLRDFATATEALVKLHGDKAFFKLVAGNTHEDMVLEMATVRDEVGPAIAAFAKRY